MVPQLCFTPAMHSGHEHGQGRTCLKQDCSVSHARLACACRCAISDVCDWLGVLPLSTYPLLPWLIAVPRAVAVWTHRVRELVKHFDANRKELRPMR